MLQDKKIGFIGGGNMGEALISGLVLSKAAKPENIICSDIAEDLLEELKEKYALEGGLVEDDLRDDARAIRAELLDPGVPTYDTNDAIAHTRALIRHDAHKLAKELMNIVNNI